MDRALLVLILATAMGACHHRSAVVRHENPAAAPQVSAGDAAIPQKIEGTADSDDAVRLEVLEALRPMSSLIPLSVDVTDGIVTIGGLGLGAMTYLSDQIALIDGVTHVFVRPTFGLEAYASNLYFDTHHFERFYAVVRSDRLGLHVAKPSAVSELPRHLVFNKENIVTVSDAMNVIARAMGDAKYPTSTLIQLVDGLALITPLEQIDAKGCAVGPKDRWSIEVAPLSRLVPSAYLDSLFSGREGFYRVLLIAITAKSLSVDSSISADDVFRTQRRELLTPTENEQLIVTPSHRVWVLVYEFRKMDTESNPTQATPGRLTALEHLRAAGILEHLEKRNAPR